MASIEFCQEGKKMIRYVVLAVALTLACGLSADAGVVYSIFSRTGCGIPTVSPPHAVGAGQAPVPAASCDGRFAAWCAARQARIEYYRARRLSRRASRGCAGFMVQTVVTRSIVVPACTGTLAVLVPSQCAPCESVAAPPVPDNE